MKYLAAALLAAVIAAGVLLLRKDEPEPASPPPDVIKMAETQRSHTSTVRIRPTLPTPSAPDRSETQPGYHVDPPVPQLRTEGASRALFAWKDRTGLSDEQWIEILKALARYSRSYEDLAKERQEFLMTTPPEHRGKMLQVLPESHIFNQLRQDLARILTQEQFDSFHDDIFSQYRLKGAVVFEKRERTEL
jgi:hypothetical protein